MKKVVFTNDDIRMAKDSIKKWEGVLYHRRDERGPEDCPFCAEYYVNGTPALACWECPIYILTGERFCGNTPYENWITHQDTHFPLLPHVCVCEICRHHAAGEIIFLKEILERVILFQNFEGIVK